MISHELCVFSDSNEFIPNTWDHDIEYNITAINIQSVTPISRTSQQRKFTFLTKHTTNFSSSSILCSQFHCMCNIWNIMDKELPVFCGQSTTHSISFSTFITLQQILSFFTVRYIDYRSSSVSWPWPFFFYANSEEL